MANKKVVVAGATGLVGNAALRHFGATGGCDVLALSRRKPRELHGARHIPIDLTDPAQCRRAAADDLAFAVIDVHEGTLRQMGLMLVDEASDRTLLLGRDFQGIFVDPTFSVFSFRLAPDGD